MVKSFRSTAALQTMKKTRSSRTWRTQALRLHPRSGQAGSQTMVRAVGAIPMVRSLLSPMWWSMHHKESNLGHHHPLALSHHHHHPHPHRRLPLLPHQECARPLSARTMMGLTCSPVPPTPAARMSAAASAPPQMVVGVTLGFMRPVNAG